MRGEIVHKNRTIVIRTIAMRGAYKTEPLFETSKDIRVLGNNKPQIRHEIQVHSHQHKYIKNCLHYKKIFHMA